MLSNIAATAACVTLIGVTAAQESHAQAASDRPGSSQSAQGLEEIVVTATKRDTALVEVPIAVTVFTLDDMEQKNITRPADFISMTPNVHLTDAIRPGSNDVSMRGVQGNYGLTQPVALVVDGVASANPRGLDRELIAIQQIEVVRGPQSAVYGRNANAGAIIINTVRPSDDFLGKVTLGAGNGGAIKGQAMVSGPIVEGSVYGRLALSAEQRDGYWDNKTLGRPQDEYHEYIADARIVYDATERLSFDLRARGSELQQGAELWSMQVPAVHPFDVNNYFPPFQMNNESTGFQNRGDFALKVAYEMPFATLTAIGAYSHYRLDEDADGGLILSQPGGAGGAPLAFLPGGPQAILGANPPLLPGFSYSLDDGNGYIVQQQNDKTVELRLASPSEGRFRWMGGVYFADSDGWNYNSTRVDKGQGVIRSRYAPELFDINSSNPIRVLRTDDFRNEAHAAFGQLQYDFSDRLEGSAALRWDDETKRTVNTVPLGNSPVTGQPWTNPILAPSGQVREEDYSAVQPQVSLRYKVSSDLAFYASYGEGFRSGGFNAAGAAQDFGYPEDYPSENSQAYEVGMKSQWLDRRVLLNVALFHTDIDNAQAFVYFATPRSATINITLDKVRAQGVEVEAAFRVTDNLTIANNFGITDAKTVADKLPAVVGKKVPQMPEYTNSLSVDYNRPLAGSLSLSGNVSWSLEGPMWFDVYNTPYAERDPLSLINARLALKSERDGGGWDLALWAKNLRNEWYNQYAAPAGPVMNVYRGVPRTYGASLTYRF